MFVFVEGECSLVRCFSPLEKSVELLRIRIRAESGSKLKQELTVAT